MMTFASGTYFKEQLTLNINHYQEFSTGNVGRREMGTKFQDRYKSSQIPHHYHRLKQKKNLNGLCHKLCNICMMRSECM
jgi:hypothetical protein